MTILWIILLWPISTQHGGTWELWQMWIFWVWTALERGHSGSTLVWTCWEREMQNGTCYISVHLRNFCSDTDSVCTENVLHWKKKYTYGNSLKIWVGQQNIVFSVLIVIVHACLSGEGDNDCHCFWKGKEETGPMIQTLSVFCVLRGNVSL